MKDARRWLDWPVRRRVRYPTAKRARR
jgi:hypothetical protein